jgi:hypothetical protein
LYFKTLSNEKLFFTRTNRAAINPISADNQTSSTCTISSITCTNYAAKSVNPLIINKLINAQIIHLHKLLKINNLGFNKLFQLSLTI